MTDEEYLKYTIQLAADNVDHDGGPFAAIVVKEGTIIAEAGNRVTEKMDPTAHAEVQAIRSACETLKHFELKGCELYVSCEPCPMCVGAIYWARPDQVYFAAGRDDASRAGFDDNLIYKEVSKDPQERSLPFRRINVQDAALPFKKWERKEDKSAY
ncbi:tRNA-specific adenosine deaminase [Halobacillus halophilus]|uniref:Guanine deaminase n=1 Tax=Halobacillus halophilus (strain ATCC 35676 / DSM 2266 / JCM 20832 / KCTC 3685 / LMG 17431 / NBRC 102448 / NCIMB 2269) TaxID=866895 RepID=I0JHH7_HALH3|nr:nucleoside deaminase [Halobacillus halophilus]ASF37817.1 tRNA-specific adenosine deaminase [Halobacillus halophilus]CCG43595.1 guanine deaminase [Halobacillus halophilus DSM 2266]